MKKFLLTTAMLLLSSLGFAQMNERDGTVQDTGGRVVANALVRVCSPGTATTSAACNSFATIYSDYAGLHQVNQASAPLTTDYTGTYIFYTATSPVDIQIQARGQFRVLPYVTVAGGSGGTAGVTTFNGDGNLIANSNSTGTVTIVPGTGPTNNFWSASGAWAQPTYFNLSGSIPQGTTLTTDPATDDNSQKVTTTSWVRKNLGPNYTWSTTMHVAIPGYVHTFPAPGFAITLQNLSFSTITNFGCGGTYPVFTITRVSDNANIVAPFTLPAGINRTNPYVITSLLINSLAATDQIKMQVTTTGVFCTPNLVLSGVQFSNSAILPPSADSLGSIYTVDCSATGSNYLVQKVNNDGTSTCAAAGGGAIYAGEQFGIVGDGTTDDCTPLSTALTTVAAAGGGFLQLPRTGHKTKTSCDLTIPPGVGIIGCGMEGNQIGTLVPAACGLLFTHTGGTAHILMLSSGRGFLRDLALADSTGSETFIYVTGMIPVLQNVSAIGKGSALSAVNAPVNKFIVFGDNVHGCVPGSISSGYCGYGLGYLDNIFVDNITTVLTFGNDANGIYVGQLNVSQQCSDGIDGVSGYAIVFNAASGHPAYGNVIGPLVSMEMGAFGGAQHYKGGVGMLGYAGTNDIQVSFSELDGATSGIYVTSGNAASNRFTCQGASFATGCVHEFSGSYPDIIEDMSNDIVSARYFEGVNMGTLANPFNYAYIAVALNSGNNSNTDTAGHITTSTGGGPYTGVYSFTGTWTNQPDCIVQDDSNFSRLSSKTVTNTSITVTTTGNGDNVAYICVFKG